MTVYRHDLASFDDFAAWLLTELSVSERPAEDDSLASIAPDPLARFTLFASLEALIGEDFPTELLESMVSVGDVYLGIAGRLSFLGFGEGFLGS